MVYRVNTTDVRPQLTKLLGMVEHGNRKIIIARHGNPVAVIVSMKDFDRVWEAEEEELYGPVNPASGRRRGAYWWVLEKAKQALGKTDAE